MLKLAGLETKNIIWCWCKKDGSDYKPIRIFFDHSALSFILALDAIQKVELFICKATINIKKS